MAERIRYRDFELEVQHQGSGFIAHVRSPGGEASQSFQLPFTAEKLELLVLRMTRRGGVTRRIHSPEIAAAQELGGSLFDAIFRGEVLGCFRASLDDMAREEGVGLRFKLRLQDAPELASWPWEFLYDRALNRFPAQSNYTPIVRYLDLPQRVRPLMTALPLKVIVMISSPDDPDYPSLDVAREKALVAGALDALEATHRVQVAWMEQPTLLELQRLLRSDSYHVLHYIGHGGFDPTVQEGLLILSDEDGRSRRTSATQIGLLLQDHRSLRLVVLNSCEGARNSRDDPFSSSASSLIQQGVPAVVAMQFEITDQAAITFAGEFYAALAEGLPVDTCVAEGRKALVLQGNDIEWATPVLYLRAPDGVLFQIAPLQPAELSIDSNINDNQPSPPADAMPRLRRLSEAATATMHGPTIKRTVETGSTRLAIEGNPGRVLSWLLARPVAAAALTLIVGFYAAGAFAPLLEDLGVIHHYAQQDLRNRLSGPSTSHPFGTDWLGRDQMSRVAWSCQVSLILTLVWCALTALILLVAYQTGRLREWKRISIRLIRFIPAGFLGLELILTWLSFGLPRPPSPTFIGMLRVPLEGPYSAADYPHLLIFPTAVLIVVVLAFDRLAAALGKPEQVHSEAY
jgi:ABC-type dipeptide/oligopeptide/nickel transport system permease subunit